VRDVSRISSAGGRDVQNGTAADTPPQRGPKRKRKSAGAERRLNGDMMMDIDAPVGPTSVLDPAVPEAESPLAVIEEAPIVDTLSIGQSKESFTEQPRDLLPDTSFVAFENKPTLEHVKWSPHHPQALFTAGKNHMRTYQIKTPVPESGLETVSQAGQVHSEAFDIEAFCWTERKQGVFSTRETFENEHGNTMTRSKLFSFTDFSRKASLLDPMAGTIVALQYNSDSKLLLCLSYGEVAVIRIWKLTDSGWEYKTMKTIRAELYDAAWTADTTFIVCGISTLELYDVTDEITVVKSVETPHDWFRLKFDKVCDIVACLDERMHALGIMKLGGDLKVEVEPFKDAQISEFAFQPIKNKASRTESTPRLLATATTNGKVQVWNSLVPFTLVHEFNMGKQATAQTLAFSPDGFYLAAAGYDSLVIWKSEEGGEPKAIWKIGEAHERWKCVPGDAEEDWLHALSWDADGKKIAFGLNSQVCYSLSLSFSRFFLLISKPRRLLLSACHRWLRDLHYLEPFLTKPCHATLRSHVVVNQAHREN